MEVEDIKEVFGGPSMMSSGSAKRSQQIEAMLRGSESSLALLRDKCLSAIGRRFIGPSITLYLISLGLPAID